MDDGIELMPDGRFRLLGRLDRVVKIEEKRLSLPEMEARLAASPLGRKPPLSCP
jgi:acyl-coenzyme A synthetase/AMP-(fatty) acid ligase